MKSAKDQNEGKGWFEGEGGAIASQRLRSIRISLPVVLSLQLVSSQWMAQGVPEINSPPLRHHNPARLRERGELNSTAPPVMGSGKNYRTRIKTVLVEIFLLAHLNSRQIGDSFWPTADLEFILTCSNIDLHSAF